MLSARIVQKLRTVCDLNAFLKPFVRKTTTSSLSPGLGIGANYRFGCPGIRYVMP